MIAEKVSSAPADREIEQLRGRISALKDALALSESRNDLLNSEIDRLKEEIEKLRNIRKD